MKLLITAIGKRVQLIEHLKSRFRVVGLDATMDNAARDFTDKFYQIAKCSDEYTYKNDILSICKEEQADVIIPLYEPEFQILNQIREEIEKTGAVLLLSDENVIDICNDKYRTTEFLNKYNIPAPVTVDDLKDAEYPLVIKPCNGMGSSGVHIANDYEEAVFYAKRTDEPIIQEKLTGDEYTVDVLCDLEGMPIYIVPRHRDEVRSGEVSKSTTVGYNTETGRQLVEETYRLVEALRKEGMVRGPLTIQYFYTENGIVCLEVNPRFGGGVPLSFEAGADYAGALSDMLDKKPVKPCIGEYKHIQMLRYDMAVYR